MIKEFLDFQRTNKGLAEETLQGYEKELRRFVDYAKPLGLRWSTITAEDMNRYVEAEQKRGMAPRTIKKRVEVVRLVLTYAQHHHKLTENAARYTQTPRIADSLPRPAETERLKAYLATPATTRTSMLVHAITAIIMDTGLRIGELTNIKGNDINTNKRSIRITGKGRKERIVYYSSLSAYYLDMMSQSGERKPLPQTQVEYRYMMYAELPGIHPHAIRHTFATEQLKKGMPLKTLSVLMGHKHIETTEIYTHLDDTTIQAQYRALNS